jgi:hypothetical protein
LEADATDLATGAMVLEVKRGGEPSLYKF